MPKTTVAIASYFDLLLNNSAWAAVGDVAGIQPSASDGSLYVSLHTASPGIDGDQTTNEAAYTGYARVAVVRTSSGWIEASPDAHNAAQVTFPQCTASPETEYFCGIGTDSSGAGNLLYFGPITTSRFYGMTGAESGDITVPGNGFFTDDQLVFFPICSDIPLPDGITAGQSYYVLTHSGDVITVSATMGGSPVSIGTSGAGVCARLDGLQILTDDTPAISASNLQVLEN